MTDPIRFTADPCPDCGHPTWFKHDNTEARSCPACNDQAQLGTYAPCATVSHEPWTDADTAELAAAMDDARWAEGTRHALARIGAGIITSTAPSTSANSPSTLRQLAEAGRAERAIDNLTDDSPRAYALVAVLVADHRAHRAY